MSEPNYERSKHAAQVQLRKYGVTDPSEIDLEVIAWGLGIEIKEASLRSSEAQLLRRGNVGTIRVRHGEKDTPRGRFSIGHEIGHWCLHKDQTQFWDCTPEDIHRYKGSWMESEANSFSSELLMPTWLFKPMCVKGSAGFRLLEHLAKKFGTSLQATALRMAEESNEPVCVVLSDGEKVCWSRRNRRLSDFDFYIPKGRPLSSESLAWAASLDEELSQQVPVHAWFPTLKDSYRYTVYEDVKYDPVFDIALSILVVHED